MKKSLLVLGVLWAVSAFVTIQSSFAATPASLSGSTNMQYACAPPFLSQAAKPNIHFVLDVTGSMTGHPYVDADGTYYTTTGYWGYFKQDKYYKYDVTANNYWQENPNCTNTDLIGTTNGTTGQCISGKLLNYLTANKYDIMRKILTGGRIWASDATVLEHEQGNNSNINNEATTNCDVNNGTAGKTIISSPNATIANATTISSSSKNTTITVAKVGSTATFTRTAGGNYNSIVPDGTQIVTSGFAAAGNNGTWTVVTMTSTKITVTSNTGIVAVNNAKSVTIKTVAAIGGPICKVLAFSNNVPMTVDANAKTFTRTDTGSFITDGWVKDMTVESWGFSSSGNNKAWTIAAVTANKITVTSSGMSDVTTATNARLTQSLTAFVRIKSTTPEDYTGIVQTLYKGPGHVDTKADVLVSFYDTAGKIDYAGGSTSNSTVKNQAQTNYINAINQSASTSYTNTGPAMVAAEKYYKQEAVITASGDYETIVPSSGTALIAKKNGASDPYYDVPATGTPSNTNSPAAPCRKSFVILVSDGEWNRGTDPVGPAFNMHRRDEILPSTNPKTYHDLRPEVVSGVETLPGIQSVTTYTVYAFGDTAAGRNALITTAIFGGFTDNDNDALPYPFTTFPEPPPYANNTKTLTVKNITTGTTNFADSTDVAGTTTLFFADDQPTFPLDQCNPAGTWNAKCEEWDKSPAPHTGLPYNYFEATDGEVLATALINAVNDILARTASSTAASILGNNDNAGASLIQALFYPEKQFQGTVKASWIGEVQAFWYYLDPKLNNVTIREDSVSDQKLILTEDKVAEFTFDGTYTWVNLFADADGNGTIDNHTLPPVSPNSTIELENVKTLWRAGQSLWARDAGTRTIYTNDPTVTTVSGSRIVFDDTQATKLQPYLDVSTATGAVPTAAEVINYSRGTDITTSYPVRQRSIQLGLAQHTWKLGDVIDSTPKMMSEVRLNSYNLKAPDGYSDMTYEKYTNSKNYARRGTAFIGTNDGMLHAFKTGSNFIGSTQGIVAEIRNSDGTTPPTDLGKELWAFIPKNSLPYLQYLMLPGYQHMYFVDSTPLLVDAAIGMTTADYKNAAGTAQSITSNPCTVGTGSTYYLCVRRTTLTSTSDNQIDYSTSASVSGTSWRTVLIGSTGLGGASRATKAATNGVAIAVNSGTKKFTRTTGSFIDDRWANGMKFSAGGFTNAANNSTFTISAITATEITCSTASGIVTESGASVNLIQNVVMTPLSNLGYSAYFALDVTSETDPQLLWEFSDPRLGFTTVSPVVIRIKDPNDTTELPRNGKWYAVLASGPTGPIDGQSLTFQGKSEQPLTIFVLDLKTGALVRTFNNLPSTNAFNSANSSVHTEIASMPDNGFGGSLSGASLDADRKKTSLAGAYSDDAVYIGYAKAGTVVPISWNKGGILRLLTYDNPDPATWSVSRVIDDIGPVTSSVTKLQDVTNHKLWLFFGTGRYYVKGDDPSNVNTLFGILEPCYFASSNPTTVDTFQGSVAAPCTTTISATSTATGMTSASASTLVDQSTAITTSGGVLATGKEGWYINLGAASGSSYPKRTITNPVANSTGVVLFTAFTPSTDVCTYGGTTSVWAVKYNTGGVGSTKLKGQILIQLSTGAFQQIDVASAFTENLGRETPQYQGVPPRSEPSITTNANHFPSKRILHIQER